MGVYTGTSGADSVTGAINEYNVYTLVGGGDVLVGGNLGDDFQTGSNYDGSDTLNGGAGVDSLTVKNAGPITFHEQSMVGVERIYLLTGSTITLHEASIGSGQTLQYFGQDTVGTLVFDASADTDGSLWYRGGVGSQTLTRLASRVGSDTIDGDLGSDTIKLVGGGEVTLTSRFKNFETVQFDAAEYTLTLVDGNVAAGQSLSVDASAATRLTLDGSAEADGYFLVTASGGADIVVTGAGSDNLDLSQGGDDSVSAGGGDDTIDFGNAYTGGDSVDGGAGADTLVLSGTYVGTVTLGANVTGVETIELSGGTQRLVVTSVGVNVVDASALTAGQDLELDASTVTKDIVVTGGAGDDVIVLGSTYTAADSIDGGDGVDTLRLTGGGSVTLGANITGIETLALSGGSYRIVATDAGIGFWLNVDGSAMNSSQGLTFDGATVTKELNVTAGAGNDVILTGANADNITISAGGNDIVNAGGHDDVIFAGASLTAADSINGGAGTDGLMLDGDYTGTKAITAAFKIAGIEQIALTSGHAYSITLSDAHVAAGSGLVVNGSGLGDGDQLIFNGSAEKNGWFSLAGGAGNDTLIGGAGADKIDMSYGGADKVVGGAGNDVIKADFALSDADSIDGGAGFDTLALAGDYGSGQSLAKVTGIEKIDLANGYNYTLTSTQTSVAAAATLTVDGSKVGSSYSVKFNGEVEKDGKFSLTGGAGADTLIGGAGADWFDLSKGGNDFAIGNGGNDTFFTTADLDASDSIAGGAGTDTLVLHDGVTAELGANVSGIEKILVTGAAGSSTVTVKEAGLAAGQVLTVSAERYLWLDIADDTNGKYVVSTAAGADNGLYLLMKANQIGSVTLKGNSGDDGLYIEQAGTLSLGAAPNLLGLEYIELDGEGGAVDLTMADAFLGAGQRLSIMTQATTSLTFNGSAETNGSFLVDGTSGNDTIRTGKKADSIFAGDGDDLVNAGDGDDLIRFSYAGSFTDADSIDGGAGIDSLRIGLLGGTLTLANVRNVEKLILETAGVWGTTHHFLLDNTAVDAGASLLIDGGETQYVYQLNIDGSAETNGRFSIIGGAGNDTLTGGAGADWFDLTKGGKDSVSGGAGNDVVKAGATLTTDDTLDGGAGDDTLLLDGNYNIDLTKVTGFEVISVAAGHDYSLTLADANLATGNQLKVDGTALGGAHALSVDGAFLSGDRRLLVVGGAGNDQITGGAGNDTLVGGLGNDTLEGRSGDNLLQGGDGNDKLQAAVGKQTLQGGAGNDYLQIEGLDGSDLIDGGVGFDTLGLFGNGTSVLGTNVKGIEALELWSGAHHVVSTVDQLVAAGKTFLVDGDMLDASDSLTFNGAAELNGKFSITGGAGTDALTGGALADSFDISTGGNDSIDGGKGDDVIVAKNAFTAADTVKGGAGKDTLLLDGEGYADGVTLAGLTEVEIIQLADTHSYSLILDEQTVASGATLTVDGSRLGAADTVSVDASADTNGSYTVIGGAGGDWVDVDASRVSALTFLAGDGNDTLSIMNAGQNGAAVTLGASIKGIEELSLYPAAAVQVVSLTTNDANVTAGTTLFIGHTVNTLNFNGSAEKDGAFSLVGGMGNDVLITGGGADIISASGGGVDTIKAGGGNDTIRMQGAYTAADVIDGGAGNDTLTLSNNYDGVTLDKVTNVEVIKLSDNASYSLTVVEATVAAGATLTVDGSSIASGSVTFDGTAETNGKFSLIGGAGNDTLTGGSGADRFDLTVGGDDLVKAGGGDDVIAMGGQLTAADSIDGELGKDTLLLDGDYSSNLSLAKVAGVETIALSAGNDYTLTAHNDTVALGAVLTVDGTKLGSGNGLTFNGAAETNGSFVLLGGAGADGLTGGAGNDLISGGAGDDGITTGAGSDTVLGGTGEDNFYFGAHLSAADVIDGGQGNDVVQIWGTTTVVLGAKTVTNVETFMVEGTASLTTHNATVALNQTLVVDAWASTKLTFNGGAETDGKFDVTGGLGDDVIIGGAKSDKLSGRAGNDTIQAGAGDDLIDGGSEYTADDKIDGGAGVDTLTLAGTGGVYASGVTLSGLSNVEVIDLTTAAASYDLTAVDANVAAGGSLTVDGSDIDASNSLTFNGAAESNGKFSLIGGAGSDTLTGGKGADRFDLTKGGNDTVDGGAGDDVFVVQDGFGALDAIKGGAGNDTVMFDGGNDVVSFTASTMSEVEKLVLKNSEAWLVFHQDTVANGATLRIEADGGSNTYNLRNDTDGNFVFVTKGTAPDTMQEVLINADRLNSITLQGGGGNDALVIASADSGPLHLSGSKISGLEMLDLSSDGGMIDLTYDDAVTSAGATLEIFLGGGGLKLNAAAETNAKIKVTSEGVANDVITTGKMADWIDTRGGNDTIFAGAGDDVIRFYRLDLDGNDKIDGGLGSDTLSLYNSGVVNISGVRNVEKIVLDHGSYSITSIDDNVAAGGGLLVDARANVLTSESLTFDGSAETNGRFTLLGGIGNDTLTGGALNDSIIGGDGNDILSGLAGNDVLDGGAGDDTITIGAGNDTVIGGAGNDKIEAVGNLTAADVIDGGLGSDTLMLDGATTVVFGAKTVTNVETIETGAGIYSLTTHDATVAAGQTLVVDASASTKLTFNGAAEKDGTFDVTGGAGNDVIKGGAMADILDGGLGDDTLTGGLGNDLFVVTGGKDVITDFKGGGAAVGDVIDLQTYDLANFDALLDMVTDTASGAVIDFGGGNTLTLTGVKVVDLHANDFTL